MNLKICTYNCCSIIKNIDIIRDLTNKKMDLILIQETFLTSDKLGILDFIDENYNSFGVPAYFTEQNIIKTNGRPMGGLVCLWKKNSFVNVNILSSADDYVVLNLAFSDLNLTLVNVYIRSDLGDVISQEKYLYSLSQLENILLNFNCNNVIFAGDFNTDPFIGRAWANFKNF